MCGANNGSDDGGGGGGGEGSGGLRGPSCKKPQKRQRVPKRGPGVAELEKILREQQKNIMTSTSTDNLDHHEINVVDQGRFHVNPSYFPMSRPFSSHNIDVHYLQLPSINPSSCSSSTTSFSTARSHHHLVSRPTKPLPSHHGSGSSAVGGAGGGMFLPGQKLFPWTTDERKLEGGISLRSGGPVMPNTGKRNEQHCRNPISMMNHFPGSASSSSNNPPSVGLCHQIEPPSSQRLCRNLPSIGPHEKVIGVKRPLPPPSVDNPAAPTCPFYQAPQVPSLRHRTEQPTSFNQEIGYNTNLFKQMLRYAKWDVPPLEFNYLQNYDAGLQGAPDGNFFRFVSGNAAFSLPLQFPKFDHTIPYQDSNQRPISAEPNQNKPFYSFLPSKEQAKETLRGLNIERGDRDGEDDIDLNLKLSTS